MIDPSSNRFQTSHTLPIAAIVISVMAFTATIVVCTPWMWQISVMPPGEGPFPILGEMVKCAAVFLAGMAVSLCGAAIGAAYRASGKYVLVAELQIVFALFLFFMLSHVGR